MLPCWKAAGPFIQICQNRFKFVWIIEVQSLTGPSVWRFCVHGDPWFGWEYLCLGCAREEHGHVPTCVVWDCGSRHRNHVSVGLCKVCLQGNRKSGSHVYIYIYIITCTYVSIKPQMIYIYIDVYMSAIVSLRKIAWRTHGPCISMHSKHWQAMVASYDTRHVPAIPRLRIGWLCIASICKPWRCHMMRAL